MKIGLCAWSFSGKHKEAGYEPNPHSAQGLLTLARSLGLASIEGSAGWFESMSDDEVAAFRDELSGAGMGVFVDTGGHGLADPTHLTKAIAAAERVGSSVVRTTISKLLEGDRRELGADGWRAHVEALVAPLKEASARAADAGIAVGVENHQDICSHELAWLCEEVGGDAIGVIMDVGNAYAVGETPAAFAERVRPWLKHIHLKDYTVHPTDAGFRLKRCPLGGVVRWPEMLPWFDANTPDVQGCIELGATQARHIRLFEPTWWGTYPERPFVPDAVEAIGDLHRAAADPDNWQTPHETGDDAKTCADYELDQIRKSVDYLKSIDAL